MWFPGHSVVAALDVGPEQFEQDVQLAAAGLLKRFGYYSQDLGSLVEEDINFGFTSCAPDELQYQHAYRSI